MQDYMHFTKHNETDHAKLAWNEPQVIFPEAYVKEMIIALLKTFNISENVTQVLVGGRNYEQQSKQEPQTLLFKFTCMIKNKLLKLG